MNLKADHVLHHQTPTTNQLFTSVSLAAVLRLRISFQVAIQDRFILCEYKWVIPGEQRGSDQGHGIAVDSLGNAYLTGFTQSADFPQRNQISGACLEGCGSSFNQDTFVVKVAP